MFKNKTTVIDHMKCIHAKVLQAPAMASNTDSSSQGEDNNSTRAAVNVDDQELPQLEECLAPTLHDLVYSIMSKPDLMFSSISDSCT